MANIDPPSAPKSKNRIKHERELSAINGRLRKAAERKIFAMNVRYLRHNLGLTINDLGRLMDTSGTYVALVERGENNTSIDRMASFAQALKCPLHSLLNPRLVADSKIGDNNPQPLQTREIFETSAKGRTLKPDK
jgi:transcriptional regulator with XRE-family HTH domain